MDDRINEIRRVLDTLARVENSDNDTKEEVYDRELATVRLLNRENIVDVVKRAVGRHKRRQKYSPFVFAELYDVLGIDAAFSELLWDADADGRAAIIQTIGLRRMRSLVGVLNDHFVRESDDFCRECLLHTLALLSDKSSLPIFEHLMRKADARDQWRLLVAGRYFGSPEFQEYLTWVFNNPDTQKSHRVVAAWGLGKLGDRNAYEYLKERLDDPPVRTEEFFGPGESLRAAQAIADINAWDFEWHTDSVALVKEQLAESN